MPSMPSMAVRTCSWWASLVQLTTTSSSRMAVFTSKPRSARMLPPTSPMAMASWPSMPGSLTMRTRMRTENAGVGVSAIANARLTARTPHDEASADAQPQAAFSDGYGFTALPPAGFTPRCRCASPPAALPLEPTVPMGVPACTAPEEPMVPDMWAP